MGKEPRRPPAGPRGGAGRLGLRGGVREPALRPRASRSRLGHAREERGGRRGDRDRGRGAPGARETAQQVRAWPIYPQTRRLDPAKVVVVVGGACAGLSWHWRSPAFYIVELGASGQLPKTADGWT